MATEKVSVTIDRDVLREICRREGRQRVSAFLTEAAREKLQRMRILEYLDELDSKHGKPTPSERRVASRRVARALGRW